MSTGRWPASLTCRTWCGSLGSKHWSPPPAGWSPKPPPGGVADRLAADRLAPMLQQAEVAWTRVAQQAGRLVAADGTTDPALVRAAAESRGFTEA